MIFSKAQRFLYQHVAKPIFFRMDAENVHDRASAIGSLLGSNAFTRSMTSALYRFDHPALSQNILGIAFGDPIGLAAGFDYDAKLINILPSVGFGFHTAGTITNDPYEGNARPRLGRLPKSKSLLVNKGFKSEGMDACLDRLSKAVRTVPLGVSVGSTNRVYERFEDQVQDVVIGFQKALQADVASYHELNISCPNLAHISEASESFSTPIGFRRLLEALSQLEFYKPVFVKMHLEKSEEETAALMDVAADFPFIKGFIFSNLCKRRDNPNFDAQEIAAAGKGNFSGRPVFEGSNRLIEFAYKKYGDRFVIIGCGGVFSAEDAYEKIKRGASLVQMVTGMIYEGPQVIGEINRGLVALLKKDGFKNVSEAVGAYWRK